MRVRVSAEANGSIGGIVVLGPSDQPHRLDLHMLFVESRRIRRGVGCMLLARALAEARRWAAAG